MIETGTAAMKKISASSALERISSTMPTAIVTALVTAMIMPKAIQRRIWLMSLIMRESSWPEPQPSWKVTGRCWTFW